MLAFTPYTLKEKSSGLPDIVLSNILEPTHENIRVCYQLGEFPGLNVGVILTLYYFDAESMGELFYINLKSLPEWIIGFLEDGNNFILIDAPQHITLELNPKARVWD